MPMKLTSRLIVPALAGFAITALAVAAPQKRVSQDAPKDFPSCLRRAQTAWEQSNWNEAVVALQDGIALATEKRTAVIKEALPKAPAGWKAEPERDQGQQNPFANRMAAAMAASVGSTIERTYRPEEGRGSVRVTVTADSPLVQMLNMWMANPAMLEPGSELIEYEAHKAVLKTQSGGKRLDLQILIHGKHVCQVVVDGGSEELLFAMFDQKAVDRLAGALGE